MPKYTFTFKKDDILFEFTTQDKEVVERQFQIWIASADDYVKKKPFRPVLTPESTQKSIEKDSCVKPQEVNNLVQGQPQVFDKASDLLKTINTIQQPSSEEASVPRVEFSDVLEKTSEISEISNFEPQKTKDQVFLNLVQNKKTADKFHYLIITAYYLSEFEKMERFSLKQINSKLMDNLSDVIDHSLLQEAINQEFIELVPELTSASEADEYRITRLGEEFFLNKI